MVESMVFTLLGLHTRRPSRDQQAQTLTRYVIQNETKCDISTSPHSKQNKSFLATTTALNTNETSIYTYELLLTSADKDCFSQRVYIYIYIYI